MYRNGMAPMWRNLGMVSAVTFVVLCTSTTPAEALIQSTGSQSCSAGFYVRVDAKGQGYINIYVSNMTYPKITYHLSTIQPVDYQSVYRSASWKVTSDDILVDSGTYASCEPGQLRAQP
jgi:hypothetical protein